MDDTSDDATMPPRSDASTDDAGPAGPECGDGVCDAGEDATGCPQDCTGTPQSVCGDGVCDADENANTCAQDCQAPAECGDGICEGAENLVSCPDDCGKGGADICPGILLECMFSCTSMDCLNTCGEGQEQQLALAAYNCLGGCAGPTGQIDVTCADDNCTEAMVACWSGEVYGAGGCPTVIPCVSGCANAGYDCDRGCYQAVTYDGCIAHEHLLNCLALNCSDASGAIDATCAQAALGAGGACESQTATCDAN